jgi:hypothetical protein
MAISEACNYRSRAPAIGVSLFAAAVTWLVSIAHTDADEATPVPQAPAMMILEGGGPPPLPRVPNGHGLIESHRASSSSGCWSLPSVPSWCAEEEAFMRIKALQPTRAQPSELHAGIVGAGG